MRIRLPDKDRIRLFKELEQKALSLKQTAKITGVSTRTVSDWKRGKYTMPAQHFEKILKFAAIDRKLIRTRVLDNWWSNGEAGKKGAIIKMQKYGPPGTPRGRRLGGINSYNNRRGKRNGIFTPKTIRKPARSKLFSEFIGILIGDGGVTQYQVVVTTNSVDDYEYSLFVAKLMKQLFGLQPTLSKRKDSNCIKIVVSSVELVKFLKLNGVLQGNKLKQGLDIPSWILDNTAYSTACIRGIFDTDGCIFLERHKINEKLYCYPRLSFVSMSSNLRATLHDVLAELEFNPKIRNNRSVNLENFADISKYFRIVGSSNPKHLRRFKSFGGVG